MADPDPIYFIQAFTLILRLTLILPPRILHTVRLSSFIGMVQQDAHLSTNLYMLKVLLYITPRIK